MSAYDTARRKTKDSSHPKYKLAAVIYKSGRVLSTATNSHVWGRHAEIRAIGRRTYPGASIVISRDNDRVSKPCGECERAIRKAGIVKITFINDQGELECKRI